MLYPNIEAERAKLGISKKGFCALVGCTVVTYRNWQNGTFDMGVKELIKMTKIFGVSADYLIAVEQ